MFIERIFRADIQPPASYRARQWLDCGEQRYVSIGIHQTIDVSSLEVRPATDCPYTTLVMSDTPPEHPNHLVRGTDGVLRRDHPDLVQSKEGVWCSFPFRLSSVPANQFPREGGRLLMLEQMYYQLTRDFPDMKHVFCAAINLPVSVQSSNYRLVPDGFYWACVDGSMSDEDVPIRLKHHLFARRKHMRHQCVLTEESYTRLQQALWCRHT